MTPARSCVPPTKPSAKPPAENSGTEVLVGFSWRKLSSALVVLGVSLIVLFILGARFGAEPIDLHTALADPTSVDARILFSLRLPRLALAAVVGAALSAAGAAYQGLLRNSLADPFVLGVSGGAALGGALALSAEELLAPLGMAATGPSTAVATSAIVTGGVFAMVSFAAGWRNGVLDPVRSLLTGVVLNSFAVALIIVVRTVVSPGKAQELSFWLTGSLAYPSLQALVVAGSVTFASILALVLLAPALNLLSLGEESAASLGISVGKVQAVVFIAASVAVGVAVSVSGIVGFIGLVVPHLVRLAVGADNRMLIPSAALGGAAFLIAADLGARLLFHPLGTELPVGAITAIAGGPFFFWLLRRTNRSAI